MASPRYQNLRPYIKKTTAGGNFKDKNGRCLQFIRNDPEQIAHHPLRAIKQTPCITIERHPASSWGAAKILLILFIDKWAAYPVG